MNNAVLVTGGGGFIGSNIVEELLRRGDRVRVLDNFSTGRKENLQSFLDDVEIIEGDIRDEKTVAGACADMNAVIHQAALPSVLRSVNDPATTNDVNINGTLNVFIQARDAGVGRVVSASSSSVYGDTAILPKVETMLPAPLSPYALSKLALEHYGRIFHSLYGLECFALRYFNVFGPRQDPASDYAAVIPLFIDAFRKEKSPLIHGDGEQTRDFTFVRDVVSANLCCLEAPSDAAGAVYNVARGDRISIRNLCQTIGQALGSEIQPEFGPTRPGDVRDSQADSRLAQACLGWNPAFTLRVGLAETVDWMISQPT